MKLHATRRSPARLATRLCTLALATAGLATAQSVKINLPLPSDPGLGGGDVVGILPSPDGAWLAYRADQDILDVFELYVVPLDGSRASLKLSPSLVERGQIGAFGFTPDSERVVFVADAEIDEAHALYSAPTDGSAPAIRLHAPLSPGADVSDPSFVVPFLVSASSARVVFPADLELDDTVALYSAPLDGSTPPVRLSGALDAGRDVSTLLFLTLDGSRVLYLSDALVDERADLWVVPIDGSASPLLLSSGSGPGLGVVGDRPPAAWPTPDGLRVLYRADSRTQGTFELFRAPLDGSAAPEALITALPTFADVYEFALTPDGQTVVMRADLGSDSKQELWSVPTLSTSTPTRLSGKMPSFGNVDGTGTLDGPFQIAPDGARVVYRADPRDNERFEIFSAPVDGSAPPVRLTPALGPGVDTTGYRMSPDGEWVVYVSDQRALFREELFSVPITGGPVRRLSGDLLPTSKVQRDYRVGTERVVFRVDALVDEQFELLSAPLTGFPPPVRSLDGSPRISGPTRLTPPLETGNDVDGNLALLPGGTQVVYLADLASPQQKEAFVSPLDGGTAPLIVSGALIAGPPWGDVDRFGFAGQRAWYSATQDDPRFTELYSVMLDEPFSRVKLHDHGSLGGHAQYPQSTPDGQSIVYRSDPDVIQQYDMFVVPADGSAPPLQVSETGPVPGADVADDFSITPDGLRVVYRGNLDIDSVDELFSAPLDASAPQVKLNAPLPMLRDVAPDVHVSPDGQWVVYRADQDTLGKFELFSAPSDGSFPAVKLNGSLISEGDVASPSSPAPNDVRITADSSHVVFAADAVIDGVLEVYSAPIDGASAALRLHAPLGPGRIAVPAALSPDGSVVLFRSDMSVDERYELFAVPVDGSQAPVRVSQGFTAALGVTEARVSLDGTRAIYVVQQNDYGVFSAPIDGSQAPVQISVPNSPTNIIRDLYLAPDGQHVVYNVEGSPDRLYTGWVDGTQGPVLLAEFNTFTSDLAFAAGGEIVYRAISGLHPDELFRVPLSGQVPAGRLHPVLPIDRDVTGFALDATGTLVLYRVDLEADERYELYLIDLSPPALPRR